MVLSVLLSKYCLNIVCWYIFLMRAEDELCLTTHCYSDYYQIARNSYGY